MTRAVALAALFLAAPAFAQEGVPFDDDFSPEPVRPWTVEPYWEPISHLQGQFVTGPSWSGRPTFTAQVVGGVLGGVRYRQNMRPHLFGYTRAQGTTTFSITHGTLGLDGRIGSFFGVDGKWVRATTGPDFFYNAYGISGGGDYILPASPGLAWDMTASFKATKDFWVTGTVAPGWTFDKDRFRDGILDELHMELMIAYFGLFDVAVGWQVDWNAAGRQHGPVVMARFQ